MTSGMIKYGETLVGLMIMTCLKVEGLVVHRDREGVVLLIVDPD